MNIIDGLHPAIRKMTEDFIEACAKEGIELKPYFGLRTWDTQTKLYNQPTDGIDNDGDGLIDEKDEKVTNAKAGQSFHNYGLAVDVVPIVNKKADWNSKLWTKIGEIGESIGFEWGGRWKFVDKPHFQFPKNTKYTVLQKLKQSGKVDINGYVIL